jgi:hypothetical protein
MSHFEILKHTPRNPLHEAVISGEMSFLDWLRHPQGGTIDRDRHVRQIAGALDGTPNGPHGPLTGTALLDFACQALSEFAYFGIHEHFVRSIQALHETFGWDSPAEIPHLNPTSAMNHPDALSPLELRETQRLTELDMELYRFAHDLFARRYLT